MDKAGVSIHTDETFAPDDQQKHAPPRARLLLFDRRRARPARGQAAGGLTPSEHRVAALAAPGQTNREIADALHLTVRSVEWHLGNTYRKLDIRGRRELADRLAYGLRRRQSL